MALRKIVLPLDTAYTKTFKIDNFGFFVNKIPPGLEAYIISNNEPNTQIVLETQTTIPSNTIIKEFTFTNVNPLPGKVLTLYYAESIKDFDYIPQTSIAVLEGSLEQTNQILNEIRDNTYVLDTEGIELTLSNLEARIEQLNNVDFAKNSTLTSVDTKLDDLNDNISPIPSKLDLLDEHLLPIDSKIIQTNTKLDTLNNNILPIQTKIDNLINNVLPIHDKLDILDNHILPIDSKIATTNTKLDKLTDLETKLTAMDTKLDTLDSIDFAKDTTLSSVDTKLDTLSALDLKLATLTAIETKLDNLNTKLDTLNTKIETLNTNILATNSKLDTLHNDNLLSIDKLETSNTYLYDIKNNTMRPT